jgi:tetratricopeptide (TPR) repeat protein
MMERSVEEYTQAIKICPNFTVAYNNRAVSYQRLGRYDLALSDDTKAIEMNPSYAPAFNNRGNTYFFQSDWANAIADYTKTISLDEFHPEAYFNRALVYQLMGEEVLALKDAYLVTQLKSNYGFVEELYKILRKRVHTKCCDPLTTMC